VRDFERGSSEIGGSEVAATMISANLNKKIKKMDYGNEISKITKEGVLILVVYIFLAFGSMLFFNIYCMNSLNGYKILQESGFKMLRYTSVPNILNFAIM